MNEENAVYQLVNDQIRCSFLAYGARLHALSVCVDGCWRDVIVGLPQPSDYMNDTAALGAVVDPFANRIAFACFDLGTETIHLDQNHGQHHLHGGAARLDHKNWIVSEIPSGLCFTHTTTAGEAGYPGVLHISLQITLLANGLQYEYNAHCTDATIINLSNHTYFNLSLADADVRNHQLKIFDDRYVTLAATPGDFLPTGGFSDITELGLEKDLITKFDQNLKLDHCLVLRQEADELGLRPAAELSCDGLVLKVSTTEPGLQIYTGDFLETPHALPRAGMCLETQHFPDSPNQLNFPTVYLMPGQEFCSMSRYQFGVI